MSVYVGVPMWPYRGMVMCHMVADTEAELDAMARQLGLRPEWKQGKCAPGTGVRIADLRHYDIAKSKRAQAIRLGAVPLDDMHAEAAVLKRLVRS